MVEEEEVQYCFVESEESLHAALYDNLHRFSTVNVLLRKNFLQVLEAFDCLVLPIFTSPKFDQKGLINDLARTIGEKFKDALIEKIDIEYLDDVSAGISFIMPFALYSPNNSVCKYVAVVSLATSGIFPEDFAYRAMRGLLLCVRNFNLSAKSSSERIRKVLVPSLVNQEQEPKKIRQIAIALEVFYYRLKKRDAEINLLQLHERILKEELMPEREKLNYLIKLIRENKLRFRGFESKEDLDALFLCAFSTETSLMEAACAELQYFLRRYIEDEVVYICPQQIHTIIVSNKDIYTSIMKLVRNNHIELHVDIDENEILEITTGRWEPCSIKKGKWKGHSVAITKFPAGAWLTEAMISQEVRTEIATHCLFKHHNIVTFYGAHCEPTQVYIVTEWMTYNLRDCLQKLSIDRKLLIAHQIAKAISFLHSNDIVHRGLAPESIFVDEDFTNAKLGNFGIFRALEDWNPNLIIRLQNDLMFNRSMIYVAPERWSTDHHSIHHDLSIDIYSYGFILWELLAGKNVDTEYSKASGNDELFAMIQSGHRPNMKDITGGVSYLSHLITHCWHSSPKKRPSAEELLVGLESKHKQGKNLFNSARSTLGKLKGEK